MKYYITVILIVLIIPFSFSYAKKNNSAPESKIEEKTREQLDKEWSEIQRMTEERDIYCGKNMIYTHLEHCRELKMRDNVINISKETIKCFTENEKMQIEYTKCLDFCDKYPAKSKEWAGCYLEKYKVQSSIFDDSFNTALNPDNINNMNNNNEIKPFSISSVLSNFLNHLATSFLGLFR